MTYLQDLAEELRRQDFVVTEVPALDPWKSYSEGFGYADQKLATERNAPVKVATSRIRVQLNRPLTWAEKEELETNYVDADLRRIKESTTDGFKLWVSPNREHVWVEAPFGSRLAYELVAASLEYTFVNVFPRAVRTFREYNGE